MKIINCVQGTGEWWEAKRGIPSASNFDRILTPKTCKPSASQDDYIHELIGDCLCLSPNYFTAAGKPVTQAMQDGVDTEPEARAWYELDRRVKVRRVGFCITDDERFGCSPDGLVGEDGGLELKCPLLKTQAKYLLEGVLPWEYRCQVHGSLIVTGRQWWDFMSYAPGMPAFVIRVVPDRFSDALRAALNSFHLKYVEALERIRALNDTPKQEDAA